MFVGKHGGVKNWVKVPVIGSKKFKKNFSRVLSRLSFDKIIQTKKNGKDLEVILTKAGIIEFLKLRLVLTEELPEGFCCMVVFDIPETENVLRNLLRQFLKDNCFFPLQKSVWISQFDMVEILRELFAAWNIEKWVRVFVICEKGVPEKEKTHK